MDRRKFLKEIAMSMTGICIFPMTSFNWKSDIEYDKDIIDVKKIFRNKIAFRKTSKNELGMEAFYWDKKIEKQLQEDNFYKPKGIYSPKKVRKNEKTINELEILTTESTGIKEERDRAYVWGWRPLSSEDKYGIFDKEYYLFEKENEEKKMNFYLIPKQNSTTKNLTKRKSTLITSEKGIYEFIKNEH